MATPTRRTATRRVARSRDEVPVSRESRPTRDHRPIRMIIVTLVIVAVLLVATLVGFIVLSNTPAFTITSIDAEDTEHLTAENIAKLADVSEGTTLLNIDEGAITENLKRNPWVGEVSFVREFPDRLKIVVNERRVDCLVKMSTGSVCWCLGNDNVWIEPVNLTTKDGQSANDVALALAQDMGALLVYDVPTSISPSAGSPSSDEVLKAVFAYREQFSEELSSQIVSFSAPSVESISCLLKSGVEVSLGAPNNIDIKESVITEVLAKHPNQVTYINVRVPSQPSYRKVGISSVSPGTGVTPDVLNQQTMPTPAPQPTTSQDESTESEDEEEYEEYEDYSEEEYYDTSYEEEYYDDSSSYTEEEY